MNEKINEPLGMPKGSVRAILSLFTVVTIVGAYIASMFVPTVAELPTEILALPVAIISYYVGQRSNK